MPAPADIVVTTAPFGAADPTPLRLLTEAGASFRVNATGRKLAAAEVAEIVRNCRVIIAGTETLDDALMAANPSLQAICRVGVGLDGVDLRAARARGIAVSYTPEAPSPAVAELAIGLMLDGLRHVSETDRDLRAGVWRRRTGRRLAECTVGIIGVGRIGRRVARHLSGGFPGVRVLLNDLTEDRAAPETAGAIWTDKETLLRDSDVVTIHTPLTSLTRGMIGSQRLTLMKPTALLINTARGGVVEEEDLRAALEAGTIAAAAVDVFENEPYAGPLIGCRNAVLTAHMGSMTADCRARMEIEATEEAIRFLRGEPLRSPVDLSEA